MLSGRDPSHVFQRPHEPDRPVAAHPKVAHVVEEDHAGGRIVVDGLAEQSPNHCVMASRFPNDCGTKIIKIVAEAFQPFLHRSTVEIGETRNDDAG